MHVLGVNEEGPYYTEISGRAGNLHLNEYEEIELITEEQKTYYFCVEGSFKEYGGMEIKLAELLNIPDADMKKYVGMMLQECQINTIYYRENGIINMNLSKEYETGEISQFNVTFRYDGERVQIVPTKSGQEYGEGTYLEAFIPSIATYPSEFPY